MKQLSDKNRTIRLSTLVLVMIALILAACALMIFYATRANHYIAKSMELSKQHMKYTDIASTLSNASHTLTEQARLFAETGDLAHLRAYFEEADVEKHREKAMEALEETAASHNAKLQMEASLQYSMLLMNREYYAMKLTALAYDIPVHELPDVVEHVMLTEADAALSAEEMKVRARGMLFDEAYMNAKALIQNGTGRFLDAVTEETESKYLQLSDKVVYYTGALYIVILAFTLLLLLTFGFLYFFVIRPITVASRRMQKGDPIRQSTFLYELSALAASYNRLMTDNSRMVVRLRDMAATDALTGLGNRMAYNDLCARLSTIGGEVLLAVFDVNNLREMNNNFGHKDGDRLLRTAADCIADAFGKDNCFRIGGDEFAALILGADARRAEEYTQTFREACEKAQIKVAVGCRYEREVSEALLRRMVSEADKLMYLDKARLKGEKPEN